MYFHVEVCCVYFYHCSSVRQANLMFVYEEFRASLVTFIHHLKALDLLLIYLEGLQNYLSALSKSFLW